MTIVDRLTASYDWIGRSYSRDGASTEASLASALPGGPLSSKGTQPAVPIESMVPRYFRRSSLPEPAGTVNSSTCPDRKNDTS
jgi:hypothetical protein